MAETIALVTGATGALGKATASALAKAGAVVLMVARDPVRGEAARREVEVATGRRAAAHLLLADLSDLASVRDLASQVTGQFGRLDGLIHTAAVYRSNRVLTPAGFELMFATNHLGPFLLTHLLLERLRASAPARVLVVSAPSTTRLDFDDLQGERRFRSLWAFGATKMANLLTTFELARRLTGSGVTANTFHPGIVKSSLMAEAPAVMRWMTRMIGVAPAKPAADLVYLATAAELEGVSGQFFRGRKVIRPDGYALDERVQHQLWDVSLKLLGVG